MMLESSCHEVDVNGQEIFLVDKDVLTPFSGRLRKLFSRMPKTGISTRKLKVVFRDFPGGAEGFELMSRFCYDNGRVEITPHNIVLLHRVADFMEMEEGYRKSNLRYQTVNALRGIGFWSWSELRVALRQCQSLLDPGNQSSFVEDILDCLIWRLSSRNISSSCTTSTDSSHSSCTCSSDSCSASGLRSSCSVATRPWWFQELLFLDINWIYKITHFTIEKKRSLDVLSQFLYYYLRSMSVHTPDADTGKIIEAIVTVSSVTGANPSCRYLFDVHRVSTRLGISRKHAALLERLIGSKLDEATIDQLLIRAPRGEASAYDTRFVIRLCKAFLNQYSNRQNQDRLERFGRLIDSYAYEVAPDPNLSPSRFLELVASLPASVRGSSDRIYQAIEMFCEVHSNASEEEKSKMCQVLTLEQQPLISLEDDSSRQKSKLKTRAMLSRRYRGKLSRRKRFRLTRSLDLNC